MELFTFTDDCPHSNPEDDDTYESVDDFVDDWMLRNCSIEPGWPSYPRECRESAEYAAYSVQNALYWRNRERAIAVIPLVYEYYRRLQDFEDDHSGNVCLKSPQGSVCRGCLEDDELDPDGDDGFEPGPCWRSSRAKERQSDFWHLFSEVAAKDRIPSDTSLETDQKAE